MNNRPWHGRDHHAETSAFNITNNFASSYMYRSDKESRWGDLCAQKMTKRHVLIYEWCGLDAFYSCCIQIAITICSVVYQLVNLYKYHIINYCTMTIIRTIKIMTIPNNWLFKFYLYRICQQTSTLLYV